MTTQLDLTLPTAGTTTARCKAKRADGAGPCGRPLSDPASVLRGIGPECWDRIHPAPPGRAHGEWPAGPDDPVLPLDAVHRLALLAYAAGAPLADVAAAAGLPVEEVRALAGEPP